jgi:hypothetical protein
VIEPESHRLLRREVAERIMADRNLLDTLRTEIRPLRSAVKRIQPRTATSISLVGTDGGNNSLQFDPFLVQLIRVVDSSNNEYCLQAITPSTNTERLSMAQFDTDSQPVTPLGYLMKKLDITKLQDLSHMIRPGDDGSPKSTSWVQVYRELVEWATLRVIHGTDDMATSRLTAARRP